MLTLARCDLGGPHRQDDFLIKYQGRTVGRLLANQGTYEVFWNWHIQFWTRDSVLMVRQGSTGSREGSMVEIRAAWDALPFKPDDEAGVKPPKWPWENTPQGYGRPDGKPA
jgi:hypothetical protein